MMKLLLLVALAAVASASRPSRPPLPTPSLWHNIPRHVPREEYLARLAGIPDPVSPAAQFFTQTLDHFDAENPATYQQRYWVNDTYWNATSGPVFLYIGGEGALSVYAALRGEHMELAQANNALVIAVEHRYYGASVPTDTLSTDNLRWLSSQQALADLANFHDYAVDRWTMTPKNPWFCFGGSYPGALSAWFRLKYPHIVYGAIASSAPVMAQENFEGYNEVVATSMSTTLVGGSSQCATQISEGFQALRESLSTPEGRQNLSTAFNTCNLLNSVDDLDTQTFVATVAGMFQGTVQYNNEIPGAVNIAELCQYMGKPASPLMNLANMYKSLFANGECLDFSFVDSVGTMLNVTVDKAAPGVGIRQWLYQTCTQFGYYQTCDEGTTCLFAPPSMTLHYNTLLCNILYGTDQASIPARVQFSNDYYGSNMPAGSRILFVNGHVDPWHYLSVLKNITHSTEEAIFIEGTAHCANMQSSRADDPPQLVAARKQIASVLSGWIAQAAQSF